MTYERVIALLDKDVLNEIFVTFCKRAKNIKKGETFKDIFSFDGKVDRGSSRKESMYKEEIKPLNVLNVYSDRLGITVEQEKIEEKTNEIPMIPILVNKLDLKRSNLYMGCLKYTTRKCKSSKRKRWRLCSSIKRKPGNFFRECEKLFK